MDIDDKKKKAKLKRDKLRERIKRRLAVEDNKKKKTQAKQVRTKSVKKNKRKPKPKPELFRDSFQVLSMEGDLLPPSMRFNTPSYDLASGNYINQKNVKCWTKYNKSGNPYTTCFNNDFNQQLRKGQPPKGIKKKPTKTQLKEKKINLKSINEEPNINYVLL